MICKGEMIIVKLKALSHYNSDTDTRFGDCILIIDSQSITVYDCGHAKHAEYIETFLKDNPSITKVYVVVSHNDCDHTDGICELLNWLKQKGKYRVSVYTHKYLKHVDCILDKIDDGRRNRESLKQSLLAEFDNIRDIIKEAENLGFETVEALNGTFVGKCQIVGPTIEEFTEVAAKAVDSRQSDKIGEGHAEETVMNAASVQLKCTLDNGKKILLCGDASPDYLKSIDDYNIIQLPHHGQLDSAKAIFTVLDEKSYHKEYLVSDNTGSAQTSGGSDKLVEYMEEEHYSPAYNTKNGIVEITGTQKSSHTGLQGRRFLGDLDCI